MTPSLRELCATAKRLRFPCTGRCTRCKHVHHRSQCSRNSGSTCPHRGCAGGSQSPSLGSALNQTLASVWCRPMLSGVCCTEAITVVLGIEHVKIELAPRLYFSMKPVSTNNSPLWTVATPYVGLIAAPLLGAPCSGGGFKAGEKGRQGGRDKFSWLV